MSLLLTRSFMSLLNTARVETCEGTWKRMHVLKVVVKRRMNPKWLQCLCRSSKVCDTWIQQGSSIEILNRRMSYSQRIPLKSLISDFQSAPISQCYQHIRIEMDRYIKCLYFASIDLLLRSRRWVRSVISGLSGWSSLNSRKANRLLRMLTRSKKWYKSRKRDSHSQGEYHLNWRHSFEASFNSIPRRGSRGKNCAHSLR